MSLEAHFFRRIIYTKSDKINSWGKVCISVTVSTFLKLVKLEFVVTRFVKSDTNIKEKEL